MAGLDQSISQARLDCQTDPLSLDCDLLTNYQLVVRLALLTIQNKLIVERG